MIPPTGMQVESQSISSADELVLTAYAIRELGATVVDTTDIGVHAIEYVVNNFAVFPGNGKIPAIKGGRGVLDATYDVATVAAWWGGPLQREPIFAARVPENMVVHRRGSTPRRR